MALWGLSVADRPLEAEGKTVVMRFICVAGREMVNAGHETSMAKHDFSISGFETIANAVAAENCRYGIHFMPCARATGRYWRRVWLTAEDQALTAEDYALTAEDQALTAKDQALTAKDQALTAEDQALTAEDQTLTAEDHALYSSNVQPNAAATTSGTKIMAFCCPFS